MDGGITILAPSNAAFENIPNTVLGSVWNANDSKVAVPLMLYHVLPTQLSMATLPADQVHATTLLTDPAWTSLSGGQGVLVDKQPGNLVVLVSGGGARSVLKAVDIPFRGGLVQVLDNLLVPPGSLNATLAAFQDLAFLGALYAAGLYGEVASNGTSSGQNYTFFAPSVPGLQVVNGTLSNLTAAQLRRVMEYHVVPSMVLPSTSLENGTEYPTLLKGGPPVHVHRAGNNVYVNSAQVVQSDILLDNGILHILDNALSPDAPSAAPYANVSGPQPPVFAGAVNASTMVVTALPFTTALPCTVGCPPPSVATASAGANNISISSVGAIVSGNGTRSSTASSMSTSSSIAEAAVLPTGLGILGAVAFGVIGLAL
ncbi:urea active transporter [Pestalotiopsis sp. IQ-011]